MFDDELINKLTRNGENDEAVAICLQIELNDDGIDPDRLKANLVRENFIDERLVKLASTYDANKYDASLPTYLYQTARFIYMGFLSQKEIDANMNLEHPVPFIYYIIHLTNDYDHDYEYYVNTFFKKFNERQEIEKGPKGPIK